MLQLIDGSVFVMGLRHATSDFGETRRLMHRWICCKQKLIIILVNSAEYPGWIYRHITFTILSNADLKDYIRYRRKRDVCIALAVENERLVSKFWQSPEWYCIVNLWFNTCRFAIGTQLGKLKSSIKILQSIKYHIIFWLVLWHTGWLKKTWLYFADLLPQIRNDFLS